MPPWRFWRRLRTPLRRSPAVEEYYLWGLEPERRQKSNTQIGSVSDLLGRFEDEGEGVESLLDFVFSDPVTSPVVEGLGKTREDLREAYQMLVVCGCGQWIRGRWVAGAALAHPATLEMIFTQPAVGREERLRLGVTLIEYFS